MSHEHVKQTNTQNDTANVIPAAPDTLSQQTSDDSMQTDQVSAASSVTSIPAELVSRIKSTNSNDSNLYITAESSPLTLNKEASNLSNTETESQYNQIDQYLKDTHNSNNESFFVFTSDESTEKIDKQLKQIEDLTKESLNKYFDKNIMNFVDDFNNNRLEFDRPLHSSSNDNLAHELSADLTTLETGDNNNNFKIINTNSTIENLLEDSINNAKVSSGKVSPQKYNELKSELSDSASILNKSFIAEDENSVPEEALKSSFQMIESLSKYIKEMIEEDHEIEESFDMVEKSELVDMINKKSELTEHEIDIDTRYNGKLTCENVLKNLNELNDKIDEETQDHLDKIILSNIEESKIINNSDNCKDIDDESIKKLNSIIQVFIGKKEEKEDINKENGLDKTNENENLSAIIESSLIDIKHEIYEKEFEDDNSDSDDVTDNFDTIVEYFIEKPKEKNQFSEPYNLVGLDSIYYNKLTKVIDSFINENKSPIIVKESFEKPNS